MSNNRCDCAGVGRTQGCALCRPQFSFTVKSKDELLEKLSLKVFGATPSFVPVGGGGKVSIVTDQQPIREAAIALCDALAERWFEPGDTEAQTARAVAAHRVLSDLLMEGGGR